MSDVLDIDAISNTMLEILESIVGVYELEDVSLPERRYIALNETAHDKEQLTVSFQQLYVGPPGNQLEEPQRCDSPRSIVLQIQLVRCIPGLQGGRGSTPPTEEQMIESTQTLTRDCWLLMEGAMVSPPVVNWLGGIADVSVTGPSGNTQAVQLNLVVSVP